MIPAPFAYHAPTTVADALRLLGTYGPAARLLAGGHSLLPLMKLRLAAPAHLIDLGRIPDLREIRREGSAVHIGAMATHWMIESSDLLKTQIPLLPETAAQIGDLQVRNVGTIGGSLAHADPAADYPAAVLALEATLTAEGPGGRRSIPASEFFTGLYATALGPDEILLEVAVAPQGAASGAAYVKFPHPASGFAVVGIAAVIQLDGQRGVQRVRVGVNGVAPVPYRAAGVEERLAGRAADTAALADAAAAAADKVDVNADVFASAEYRAHLARVLTRRALGAALERAGRSEAAG
ncbi:MAG: FAD binding domain-containing protein [bacterium]